MAYLDDHPPRLRQFRDRGTTPSGVIVVHTAESLPDETGPDTGAENVARFIVGRDTYGSYHDLADSDSVINLVRYDQQAYGDGTGSNPHAYHVSAATQAHRWPTLSPEWREATVRNMAKAAARYAGWLDATHGRTVPARRITREQSDRRIAGFISHAERDPGRRTDPGPAFPWDLFLTYFAEFTQEDDMPSAEDIAKAVWNHDLTTIDGKERVRAGRILVQTHNRADVAGKLRAIEAELSDDATKAQVRRVRLGIKALAEELERPDDA